MLNTPPVTTHLTAECEDCNGEGYREWSEDRWSHSASSHYTRGGTTTCEKCEGKGWYVVACDLHKKVPAVVEIDGTPYCAECAAPVAEAA